MRREHARSCFEIFEVSARARFVAAACRPYRTRWIDHSAKKGARQRSCSLRGTHARFREPRGARQRYHHCALLGPASAGGRAVKRQIGRVGTRGRTAARALPPRSGSARHTAPFRRCSGAEAGPWHGRLADVQEPEGDQRRRCSGMEMTRSRTGTAPHRPVRATVQNPCSRAPFVFPNARVVVFVPDPCPTERPLGQMKNPAFAGLLHRGARI